MSRYSLLYLFLKQITWLFVLTLISVKSVATVELSKYPESTVLTSSQLQGRYTVALAPLRNVNGQWRSDQQLQVESTGIREVLELPRNISIKEVLENYQQQLQLLGAKPLFVCSAHKCGSSASWANEFFSERRLYGLDQHQRYAVYQISGEESDRLIVLYMVTRGNQRSYLLVDQLQVEQKIDREPSVETMKALLQQGQHLQIPLDVTNERIEFTAPYGALIASLLKLDPSLRMVLAVSDHRSQSFDLNLKRSEEAGQGLVASLNQPPDASERLSVKGIGSIAPKRGDDIIVWLFEYQ